MLRNTSANPAPVGVLLVLLGLMFLLIQFVGLNLWTFGWPLIIVGVGVFFFVAMLLGGRGAGSFAIPGSVVTMVGLILFFQNTFGFWEIWSYAWTLIFVAIGSGLYIMGVWDKRDESRRLGATMAGIGAILFLIFGAFFELGVGIHALGWAGGSLWAILLIAVGLFLILRPKRLPPMPMPDTTATEDQTPAKSTSAPV